MDNSKCKTLQEDITDEVIEIVLERLDELEVQGFVYDDENNPLELVVLDEVKKILQELQSNYN